MLTTHIQNRSCHVPDKTEAPAGQGTHMTVPATCHKAVDTADWIWLLDVGMNAGHK